MITYFYWSIVVLAALAAVYLFAVRFGNWKGALVSAVVVLGTGWVAHTFYFEQIFVKRWGGRRDGRGQPPKRRNDGGEVVEHRAHEAFSFTFH